MTTRRGTADPADELAARRAAKRKASREQSAAVRAARRISGACINGRHANCTTGTDCLCTCHR